MASGSRFVKRFFPLLGGALAALCLVPAGARAQAAESFTYSAWTRVLENYVTPQGQVRYAALKANRAELDAFIDQLAAINPENRPDLFPDRATQLANWINAYNAFVVKALVDSYPVKGPLDIRYGFGQLFFKRARHVAGGRHLSLDH
ncbi:MAG: DUF547 domain-containing protein, partial [Acidobacteria bacterium]|nr:DUF547 domain-containing protein [Acidobacteriota bacterium]